MNNIRLLGQHGGRMGALRGRGERQEVAGSTPRPQGKIAAARKPELSTSKTWNMELALPNSSLLRARVARGEITCYTLHVSVVLVPAAVTYKS